MDFWILYYVCFATLPLALSLPIDELIANAAETSEIFDFMHDENAGVVSMEMDMLFPVEQWRDIQAKNTSQDKRQANTDEIRLWEEGVVPYEIDISFSHEDAIEIHKAFNRWASHTCLLFRPATVTDLHRVIIGNGAGCKSFVGRDTKPQFLFLSQKCRTDSVITHELGHTLGLLHEQSRPDRDESVQIVWDNIPSSEVAQFEKFTWSVMKDLGVPYDYMSIMHYGAKAFSVNQDNTIVTIDPEFQEVIGTRQMLSFRDIKTINLLYKCGAKCSGACPGEGFHDKNCECMCPGDPIQPCSQGGQEPGAGGQLPPGYVPPKAPVQEEVCKDANSQCPEWGKKGKCDTAQSYMHEYCRKSCKICQEPCLDRHTKCRTWAMLKDCQNNPGYMLNYCKASCSVCGQGGLTDNSQTCQDINAERCQRWYQLGHCGQLVYAEYMKLHCKKTCNLCDKESAPLVNHNPQMPTVCEDTDPNCSTWAMQGQCDQTPEYMYRFCTSSCGVCA